MSLMPRIREKKREHGAAQNQKADVEVKEEGVSDPRPETDESTRSTKRRQFPCSKKFALECLGDLSCTTPEDSIPARIELDPEVADVISFGR